MFVELIWIGKLTILSSSSNQWGERTSNWFNSLAQIYSVPFFRLRWTVFLLQKHRFFLAFSLQFFAPFLHVFAAAKKVVPRNFSSLNSNKTITPAKWQNCSQSNRIKRIRIQVETRRGTYEHDIDKDSFLVEYPHQSEEI